MGKFRNFINGLHKDGISTTGENMTLTQLIDFLGLAGTDKKALSEATYFACIKILSESIGKLPLNIQQHNDKNGVVKMRDHPCYVMLHDRPNPYMTATTFWATMEFHRNHYGNAYAYIAGADKKTELWILDPTRIVIYNDDKDLWKKGKNKIYYVYTGENEMYYFDPEEIIHLKTSISYDGITGLSVRDQLASTVEGNVTAQNMLNRLYESGFTSKAVLQYTSDLNDENAKTFIAGIEAYAKGEITNVQNIIPIPLGSQLTPLNVKLADAEFVDVKKYSALQIASAFGIKAHQINDLTKSSYASAEAQSLAFYVDTLLFVLKQYEEEIGYKILGIQDISKGLYCKFNVGVMLRADLKTQIETLSSAVSNFLYTPNEARAYLDMESLPGGDKLLGNGNVIPVDLAGTQYTNSTEGGNNIA